MKSAAFLECLWEALTKYTNPDFQSYEGQITVKDKFLSQSAHDIQKNLSMLMQGPWVTSNELLQTATAAF